MAERSAVHVLLKVPVEPVPGYAPHVTVEVRVSYPPGAIDAARLGVSTALEEALTKLATDA